MVSLSYSDLDSVETEAVLVVVGGSSLDNRGADVLKCPERWILGTTSDPGIVNSHLEPQQARSLAPRQTEP